MYRACRVYPAWYADARASLARGAWLRLPQNAPHPAACGFGLISVAEDHGQIANWGAPTPGGSRLHVHEHRDGSMVAHEDRFDPGRGVLSMLAHVLFETTGGKVAMTLAASVVVGKVVASLLE